MGAQESGGSCYENSFQGMCFSMIVSTKIKTNIDNVLPYPLKYYVIYKNLDEIRAGYS